MATRSSASRACSTCSPRSSAAAPVNCRALSVASWRLSAACRSRAAASSYVSPVQLVGLLVRDGECGHGGPLDGGWCLSVKWAPHREAPRAL